MAVKLCFRGLRDDDLPELEAMILALYQEDAYGETMSRDKIQSTVQELARQPGKGKIIVFVMADAVVGYAIMVYVWSNEYGGDIAVLDEIYVKPAWRGQGIGTAFLEYAGHPGNASVKGLQLEVTPANEPAYAFYLRQGFTPYANRQLFKKV